MSNALRQEAAAIARELDQRARDLRRPMPADWSQEEADERTAKAMEALAERLRQALEREETR